MNPHNFFKTVRTARKKDKKTILKKFICIFLLLVFLLNFLSFNNSNIYQDLENEDNSLKSELLEINQDDLKTQGISNILQDPYTKNFSKMRTFFQNNFKSPYKFKSPQDDNIPLYVSESDNTGTITDNTTYSLDNLLLYKSLLQDNYNEYDTYDAYLDLQSTPLWHYYNTTQYGFIKSIDGSTGDIVDDERYLIDNLIPIFLLLENIGDLISIISINGKTPSESIVQMFSLINSSEFWDSINNGFYETNSSVTADKDILSNLYAVLANFMIYKYKTALANDPVSNKAYERAKITMETLVNDGAWDESNEGFYYKSNSDWSPSPITQNTYKYLSVNALGILALLEYWIMTGMESDSLYYKNATALFNRLNRASTVSGGGLWSTTYNAYETYNKENWDPLSGVPNSNKIDLEANALMMLACLRLFEVSGNFTYYDRAITLFESLRKHFYNTNIDAYKISHGAVDNTNVNLHSNLRLCEAYLKGFEIYNSTALETSFNKADPNYIMNQDDLNLTSVFKFKKDLVYYESGPGQRKQKTITYANITGANITYIFRYPNDTIIEERNQFFKKNETSILFEINSSLPFDKGYSIDIHANWTYFGFAYTSKNFNVISGLRVISILGLKDWYYQGEKSNITILIYNDYNLSYTFNVSMFGPGIETDDSNKNITFIHNNQTSLAFNINITNQAVPGNINITFTFINETILYLKKSVEIEIRNALTYSNLLYSKKVVPGNNVKVTLDLINALPNATQSFNLTFSGTKIIGNPIIYPIDLFEDERRTVSYLLYTDPIIQTSSIEIEMSLSTGQTPLYPPEKLTVEVVPRLEVMSIEFPEKVTQGTYAYLIIYIQNNQESSEEFKLFINEEEVDTEIDELVPGENRIEYKIIPTWNPYEIGTKTFLIEIEDRSEEVVYKDYFESEIQISAINLICFYVLPIIILLGIILYYKNKEIKHKLLRR